mgnify:CR=1 FL=1
MIAEVEREAVLQALAQFDRLGPERARLVHGYGPGAYKVRRGRRVYDSKAIMGVAVGLQHDVEPLPPRHPFRTLANVLATPPTAARIGAAAP